MYAYFFDLLRLLSGSGLCLAMAFKKKYEKLKILGTGEIKEKINLKVDLASKSSKEKLEKIGATLNLKQKK